MFAVKYDDLKRKLSAKGVTLNKLVTAQMGTPEYETYANLFVAESNNTIHMQMEDDSKTFTFYTIVEENPLNTITKKEEPVTTDAEADKPDPTPAYEVVKTIHDTPNAVIQLVKLRRKHVARVLNVEPGPLKFIQSDYVFFGNATKTETDEQGSFTYNETTVSLTDETGKFVPAFLYFAPRRLSLEEAMFAIGEV